MKVKKNVIQNKSHVKLLTFCIMHDNCIFTFVTLAKGSLRHKVYNGSWEEANACELTANPLLLARISSPTGDYWDKGYVALYKLGKTDEILSVAKLERVKEYKV